MRRSRMTSDYDGWFCTELLTECPDCEEEIMEPSGDLDKFLTMISEHEAKCMPHWANVETKNYPM
jgi:hypothetical protein